MTKNLGVLQIGSRPVMTVQIDEDVVYMKGIYIDAEFVLTASEAITFANDILNFYEVEKPENLVEMYQRNFRDLRITPYLSDDLSADVAFKLLKIELGLNGDA